MSDVAPAPRNFARAAALYLVHETDFPTRFRRDNAAGAWRRHDPETGNWPRLPGDLAPLALEVTERLEAALGGPLPPFVFRAVEAPLRDTKVPDSPTAVVPDAVLTADDLAAATSWQDASRRLATKFAARFGDHGTAAYDRGLRKTPVGPEQRHALLKAASSPGAAEAVLKFLSGDAACRYVAAPAPVEVDARAWLNAHTRPAPSAEVPTAWLHKAYKDAVAAADPKATPLGRRAFRAVALDVLGIDPVHRRTGDVYPGVAFVDDLIDVEDQDDDAAPSVPLRLVADSA